MLVTRLFPRHPGYDITVWPIANVTKRTRQITAMLSVLVVVAERSGILDDEAVLFLSKTLARGRCRFVVYLMLWKCVSMVPCRHSEVCK